MPRIWVKGAVRVAVLGFALAGLAWFAWPQPVPVDLATVARGPMDVTVDDDGKTEVRHVYTVSAPIGGKVLRISHPTGEGGVSRHVGDQVTANDTIVAVMQPTAPGFIDFRTREEGEAAVSAADAAVKYAESEVRRLEAAVTFYRAEYDRTQALARTQAVSVAALDKAKFDIESNEASLVSAKAQVAVWQGVRASLAARLINPSSASAPTDPGCCIELRAPVSGRVLKVIQEARGSFRPARLGSKSVIPSTSTSLPISSPRTQSRSASGRLFGSMAGAGRRSSAASPASTQPASSKCLHWGSRSSASMSRSISSIHPKRGHVSAMTIA